MGREPDVLPSMGSQRVGHSSATEQLQRWEEAPGEPRHHPCGSCLSPFAASPGSAAGGNAGWGHPSSLAQSEPILGRRRWAPEVKFKQRPPSLHWLQPKKPKPRQDAAPAPTRAFVSG